MFEVLEGEDSSGEVVGEGERVEGALIFDSEGEVGEVGGEEGEEGCEGGEVGRGKGLVEEGEFEVVEEGARTEEGDEEVGDEGGEGSGEVAKGGECLVLL